MKHFLIPLLFAPLLVLAADKHDAAETKKDAQRHRAMASAHEQMAKCLEAGQKYDSCQKTLQDACKGLAIGKYCGMKHEH
jgi:hypothetical protein